MGIYIGIYECVYIHTCINTSVHKHLYVQWIYTLTGIYVCAVHTYVHAKIHINSVTRAKNSSECCFRNHVKKYLLFKMFTLSNAKPNAGFNIFVIPDLGFK